MAKAELIQEYITQLETSYQELIMNEVMLKAKLAVVERELESARAEVQPQDRGEKYEPPRNRDPESPHLTD